MSSETQWWQVSARIKGWTRKYHPDEEKHYWHNPNNDPVAVWENGFKAYLDSKEQEERAKVRAAEEKAKREQAERAKVRAAEEKAKREQAERAKARAAEEKAKREQAERANVRAAEEKAKREQEERAKARAAEEKAKKEARAAEEKDKKEQQERAAEEKAKREQEERAKAKAAEEKAKKEQEERAKARAAEEKAKEEQEKIRKEQAEEEEKRIKAREEEKTKAVQEEEIKSLLEELTTSTTTTESNDHEKANSAAFLKNAGPYLSFIDKLRRIGVGEDVPLPQIAVVGAQSVGKSSLLERLTGVQFPRDSTLCTRIATVITMRKGSSFFAQLTVSGMKINKVLHSPTEVGIAIAKITAQLTRDRPRDIITDRQIEILISGEDLPDLTLVDLPGLTQSVEDGQNEDMPNQIRELVKRWIKQPNTIILVVVPADDNLANHAAFCLAKKYDPDGVRTLGVMTKPDLINPGAEGRVVTAIKGGRTDIQLNLGYAIVKNQSALDMANGTLSRDQTMKQEETFFSQHKILSQIPTKLRGLESLSLRMTSVLIQLIQDFIPNCQKTFRDELESTKSRLRQLGTPPPRTPYEETLALQAIMRNTSELLKESSERGTIIHELRAASERLMAAISATKPKFTDEIAMLEFRCEDNKIEKITLEEAQTAAIKVCIDGAWVEFQNKAQIDRASDDRLPAFYKGLEGELRVVPSFKAHVAKMMKLHRGRELVGFYSFEAFEKIMADLHAQWEEPTYMFLKFISDALKSNMMTITSRVVPAQLSGLRPVVDSILYEAATSQIEAAKQSLNGLVKFEVRKATMNDYYVDTIQKLRSQRFQKAIDNVLAPESDENITEGRANMLVAAVFKRLTKVGNDENAMMVTDFCDMLQAYWQVSFKRYVDYATQAVDESLLSNMETAVCKRMVDSLFTDQTVPEETRRAWFIPSSVFMEELESLEAKEKRLVTALDVIKGFRA